jgi:hypothetical protein
VSRRAGSEVGGGRSRARNRLKQAQLRGRGGAGLEFLSRPREADLGPAGRRDLVLHSDDGLSGLSDAVEDLLVLDAQLGIVLGVVTDFLAEEVVLAGVGG